MTESNVKVEVREDLIIPNNQSGTCFGSFRAAENGKVILILAQIFIVLLYINYFSV